jgi:hypothetical protein
MKNKNYFTKNIKVFDAYNVNVGHIVTSEMADISYAPILVNGEIIGFVKQLGVTTMKGTEWWCDVALYKDSNIEFQNYEILGEYKKCKFTGEPKFHCYSLECVHVKLKED